MQVDQCSSRVAEKPAARTSDRCRLTGCDFLYEGMIAEALNEPGFVAGNVGIAPAFPRYNRRVFVFEISKRQRGEFNPFSI
jgi:hypothetical protein